MREHVNKSDMSYEGLISFFVNAKQDTTIPYGAGDFAVFLTRFFVDQPVAIIKPVLKKGKMKRDEDHYVYKTFYANEADSLLSSDQFHIVLVFNGWNYYTPAMDEVLCNIGSDYAEIKGSLIDLLEKAATLLEELPPSATKNKLTQAVLHIWAGRDLLCSTSVATGAASVTVAVRSIPLPVLGMLSKKVTKRQAACMDPTHPRKNIRSSEEQGESSQVQTQEEEHTDDDDDDDEDKLFTGRPSCTCACGTTFPNPEQVETHVKGEHIPSKTWSCTGTIKVNGNDQPCPEYFDNADGMWKHYRKVHLNLYHYMCSLKVDRDKECPMKFKTDERATWLYHKEVRYNVGRTPYRCQYCDRPMVQICKIKPHKRVCSQGETGKKEKLIDCRHCTKSFCGRQYYLNHLAVEHT